MDIQQLVKEFVTWDLTPLEAYRDLISTKDKSGFYPPYVPFVGEDYSKHRLLVYGMAQNVPQNSGYWENQTSEQKARRLSDASDHQKVSIAPYKQGVLPGLAGMFLHARYGVKLGTLDAVHTHLAVTNYYKFSMNSGKNDINPEKLPDPEAYWHLNNQLCEAELRVLQPQHIISFKGWHNQNLRRLGYEVIAVNDPAFILRGGGGTFSPSGRFFREAASVTDETAIQLAESYTQSCTGRYQGRKEVKLYLLKYHSDFKRGCEG